ncbi:MAG: hypothetical protein WC488_05035 [Candidatus Micrarchaeia archaeon]
MPSIQLTKKQGQQETDELLAWARILTNLSHYLNLVDKAKDESGKKDLSASQLGQLPEKLPNGRPFVLTPGMCSFLDEMMGRKNDLGTDEFLRKLFTSADPKTRSEFIDKLASHAEKTGAWQFYGYLNLLLTTFKPSSLKELNERVEDYPMYGSDGPAAFHQVHPEKLRPKKVP